MVPIGMAAGLQPALQLGMKEQQHMRTSVVNNKRRTRQVTGHGCAISKSRTVFSEQIKNSLPLSIAIGVLPYRLFDAKPRLRRILR
jgi:hypothetical protein